MFPENYKAQQRRQHEVGRCVDDRRTCRRRGSRQCSGEEHPHERIECQIEHEAGLWFFYENGRERVVSDVTIHVVVRRGGRGEEGTRGEVDTYGTDREFDEPVRGREPDCRGNGAGPRGREFGGRAVEVCGTPPRLALVTPSAAFRGQNPGEKEGTKKNAQFCKDAVEGGASPTGSGQGQPRASKTRDAFLEGWRSKGWGGRRRGWFLKRLGSGFH